MIKKLFLLVLIVLIFPLVEANDFAVTTQDFQNALTAKAPFEKFDREVMGTRVQGFKYNEHEILVSKSDDKISKVLYQTNIKRLVTEEDRLMFFYIAVSLFSKQDTVKKRAIGNLVTKLFDQTVKALKSEQQKAKPKVANYVSVNKSKKYSKIRFDMFMSANGTFNFTVEL